MGLHPPTPVAGRYTCYGRFLLANPPDNTQQIANLRAIRASGARSVTTDGVTTTFESASEIDREIARLEREQTGSTTAKPRIRGTNLSGAW